MTCRCCLTWTPRTGGAALPYRWDSSYQARLGFVPLGGTADQVRWVDIEPCWVFHPANAYDDADGRVVLDVVRYDTMFNVDVTGPNDGPARLERWTVDPITGALSVVIDQRSQEFPRLTSVSFGDVTVMPTPPRSGIISIRVRPFDMTCNPGPLNGEPQAVGEGSVRWCSCRLARLGRG